MQPPFFSLVSLVAIATTFTCLSHYWFWRLTTMKPLLLLLDLSPWWRRFPVSQNYILTLFDRNKASRLSVGQLPWQRPVSCLPLYWFRKHCLQQHNILYDFSIFYHGDDTIQSNYRALPVTFRQWNVESKIICMWLKHGPKVVKPQFLVQ